MSGMSAMASALFGMRAALAQVDRTARALAGPSDPARLPGQLVALKEAEHAFAANTAVVRTADRMVGSLLDVLG